jgi:hypothetical protein
MYSATEYPESALFAFEISFSKWAKNITGALRNDTCENK